MVTTTVMIQRQVVVTMQREGLLEVQSFEVSRRCHQPRHRNG